MSKRFTDTEIWDKEWFTALPMKLKCLTMFLYGKCDAAGVWSPNYTLASFFIGEKVTEDDILSIDNGDQFIRMETGKIYIPSFIEFQYGKLSKDCKPHIPVYRLLEKHGIDIDNVKMSDTIGKTHNITPIQRERVLRQDGYTCCYCGKEKESRNLVIDHVVARKRGGLDRPENLVAACGPCNTKKSDLSLEEFCLRNSLDFEIINKRVSDRVSQRLSNSLEEKDKDKEKEEEKEEEEGGAGGNKIYRKFQHLKISEVQFNQLMDLGYTHPEIDNILDSIENYKKNKSYTSLYLTAKKWLEKEKATKIVNMATRTEKILTTHEQYINNL